MKRLIIITLAMVLFASSAAALTADDLVWYHNQNCGRFGAKEAGPGELDSGGMMFCQVTDYILVGYKVDAPTLVGCCTCDNEAELIEFLAQCVTVCAVIGNSESDVYNGVILRQFLQARTGAETSFENAGDLSIMIFKSGDLYQMTAFTRGF